MPLVVDSLSRADGHHVYYVFYDAGGTWRFVDPPLGITCGAETLVGPSVEITQESAGRRVVVGVYEVVLDRRSSMDPDLETAERNLNCGPLAAVPGVVDVFSYDLDRIGALGRDATVLVNGDKCPTNEMCAKIRGTVGAREGGFRLFNLSFSVKLNRAGAPLCDNNEVFDL